MAVKVQKAKNSIAAISLDENPDYLQLKRGLDKSTFAQGFGYWSRTSQDGSTRKTIQNALLDLEIDYWGFKVNNHSPEKKQPNSSQNLRRETEKQVRFSEGEKLTPSQDQ